MFAAVDRVARRDLLAARKYARRRPCPHDAVREQFVDDAIGVRLDSGREEQKVLAARQMLTRRRKGQLNALNVISVKVSFTPARVWISLVTKWPMSVLSSR